MTEHHPGWLPPERTRLRWYHYALIVPVAVVAGAFALMIGSVIFFGLIAGW